MSYKKKNSVKKVGKEEVEMSKSDRQKLKHDLEYLISVTDGEDKRRYENQFKELEELKKRRPR